MRNPNFYCAVYVVIRDPDGRVLMARRQNTGYMDGGWSLPAGHVETGELPIESVVREALEEIGIVVTPDDLRPIHTCVNIRTERSSVSIFYAVDRHEGEIRNAEPDKCSELRYFAVDDLPEYAAAEVLVALAAIARGEAFSEFRVS